ncbi:MAG: DUF3617 family protein [Alphaproteobacteria bacterium]|nr:DUF3617 family protein [Alphaproteobacteria bacterium]
MRPIFVALSIVLLPTVASAQMQPGKWELRIEVTSFDIPNAPPRATEALKTPQVLSRCITPAEAAAGPLAMMKRGARCTFDQESLSGGAFDVVMTCPQDDGRTTARISGSFGATHLEMKAAIDQTGSQAMTMTTVTTARRVGDCP